MLKQTGIVKKPMKETVGDRRIVKDRLAATLSTLVPLGGRVSGRTLDKVLAQSAREYDEQQWKKTQGNIETLPVSKKVTKSVKEDESPKKKSTPNAAEKEGPFKFKEHDIIWAMWEGVYFPAVVVSCNTRRVYFYWVAEYRGDNYSFNCRLKEVVTFDDEEKNLQLRDLGMQSSHFEKFKEAYDLVTQYFILSNKRENLNAIQFLTKNPVLDTINHAKDTLYRLGVQTSDFEESPIKTNYQDIQLKEETKITPKIEESKKKNGDSTDDNYKWQDVKKDVKIKRTNEARLLLPIINSSDCLEYLKRVKEGKTKSERHSLFPNPTLRSRTGLGPFVHDEDLQKELLDIVETYTENLELTDHWYKMDVIMPEVILFAMKRHFKISTRKAETLFIKCNEEGQESFLK